MLARGGAVAPVDVSAEAKVDIMVATVNTANPDAMSRRSARSTLDELAELRRLIAPRSVIRSLQRYGGWVNERQSVCHVEANSPVNCRRGVVLARHVKNGSPLANVLLDGGSVP
jgi:hypothetical protein